MAVLTKAAFLNETVSTNQTITVIDFYSKTYRVNTTSGNISITLPFAGGGAPVGASALIINDAGANNVIITYKSGVSITLPPDGYAFLIFEGTHWELTDNSVSKTYTGAFTTNDIVRHKFNTQEYVIATKSYSATGAATGAIEIVLPSFGSNMLKLDIRLRSQAGISQSDCNMRISGHPDTGTGNWVNSIADCQANIFGNYAFTKMVRFGYRTIATVKYPTIIIGDTGDVWNYPQIQIEVINSGWNNFSQVWFDRNNYQINIVAALSGDYTNAFTVTPFIASNNLVSGDNQSNSYWEIKPENSGFELLGNATESGATYTPKRNDIAVKVGPNPTKTALALAFKAAGAASFTDFDSFLELFAGYLKLHENTDGAGYSQLLHNVLRLGLGKSSAGAISGVEMNVQGAAAPGAFDATVYRSSGINGIMRVINKGTGDLEFHTNNALKVAIDSAGLLKAQNGATVSGGDLTLTGTGNDLILNSFGNNFVQNLVVAANVNLSDGTGITVSGLPTGTYLVIVSGTVNDAATGHYIVIYDSDGTTIRGSLYNGSFASANEGACIGIISGTQFTIDLTGIDATIRGYAYMRIA